MNDALTLVVTQTFAGAVNVIHARAELRNATFVSNHAEYTGGALDATSDAQVNVNGSTFNGNDAGGFGGGLFAWHSTLLANSATFLKNNAVRRHSSTKCDLTLRCTDVRWGSRCG